MFGLFKKKRAPSEYIPEAIKYYKYFVREAGLHWEDALVCMPSDDGQFQLYQKAVEYGLAPVDLAVMFADVGVSDAEYMKNNINGALDDFKSSLNDPTTADEWAKNRLERAESIQNQALRHGARLGASVAIQGGELGRSLSGFTEPGKKR